MKGIIFYYSTTGNTESVCMYISNQLTNIDFICHDIKTDDIPDLSTYDIVGFAAFTDWWDIPYAFERFIDTLPAQEDKFAFVLNTYAQISGKTLKTLSEKVEKKGFIVMSGHSVRMPGNYPPSIARGRSFESAPSASDINKLKKFVVSLDKLAASGINNKGNRLKTIRIGMLDSIVRRYPRIHSKRQMGEIFVDESLCVRCGKCKLQCAYKAIALEPYPIFDNSKCYGCWGCFNNCPQKAIYTNNIKGVGHYSFPDINFNQE